MLSACPPCVTWRQIHRERERRFRVYMEAPCFHPGPRVYAGER